MRHVIAIGDIHGMAHTLKLLLTQLKQEFSPEDSLFVFLGDLIDRGPDSMPAVNMVCKTITEYPNSVFVLGNHDEYMRNFANLSLAGNDEQAWIGNGCIATLASYGLDDLDFIDAGKIFKQVRPRHAELFQNAVSYFETEKHFFTHAGIDPKLPLENQLDHDLRWIRKGFLDYDKPFEKVVVHGHTITKRKLPEVHSNRIALDTGSYDTGRIAAAIFVEDALTGFVMADISVEAHGIRRFDKSMVERFETKGAMADACK